MFSKIVSSVSSALDFNLATLSGCIDILVVPDEYGRLQSTPFHVRFGKAKLLRSREKIVKVTVNWQTTNLEMTLGSAGEAYFIIGESEIPAEDADEQTLRRLAEEESIKFPFNLDEDDPTTLNVESIEETIEIADYPTTGTAVAISSDPDESQFPSKITTTTQPVEKADNNETTPAPTMTLQPGDSAFCEPERYVAEVAAKAGLQNKASSPSVSVPPQNGLDDIQIEASLCGHLLQGIPQQAMHDRDVFQANRLDWRGLNEDPFLWFHPSLVFQFEGQAPYFPARIALPLIASWSMYRKSISKEAFYKLLKGRLMANYDKTRPMKRGRSRSFQNDTTAENMLDEFPSRALTSRDPFVPNEINSSSWGCDENACLSRMDTLQEIINCFPTCCSPTMDEAETRFGQIDRVSATESVNVETLARITNQEQTGGEVVTDGHPVLLSSSEQPEKGPLAFPALVAVTTDRQTSQRKIRRYKKSLKPTSDQLKSLNLKPGPNPVTFTVTSALQGTKTVNGTIYLWSQNAKIVVSDVDGTITRSDVWGQLMPIVGRDWSHPGVAQLFSAVRKADYKILYLTARAIGQADSTRDYLFGLTQNEKVKLPDGPLILSPDRLFPTIKREVIDRKPYVFKIAALRDIRNLFPTFYNPFYAGFGNRATDHRAYVHVGIPEARIFIIDPSGHVHHVNKTFAKTYESMSEMAAEMFPHSRENLNEKIPVNEKFNNSNYWRVELPSIEEIEQRGNVVVRSLDECRQSSCSSPSAMSGSTETEAASLSMKKNNNNISASRVHKQRHINSNEGEDDNFVGSSFKLNLQGATHYYDREEEEVLLTAREFALDHIFEDTRSIEFGVNTATSAGLKLIKTTYPKSQQRIKRLASDPAGYFSIRSAGAGRQPSHQSITTHHHNVKYWRRRRKDSQYQHQTGGEDHSDADDNNYRRTNPIIPHGDEDDDDDEDDDVNDDGGSTPSSSSGVSSNGSNRSTQRRQSIACRVLRSDSMHTIGCYKSPNDSSGSPAAMYSTCTREGGGDASGRMIFKDAASSHRSLTIGGGGDGGSAGSWGGLYERAASQEVRPISSGTPLAPLVRPLKSLMSLDDLLDDLSGRNDKNTMSLAKEVDDNNNMDEEKRCVTSNECRIKNEDLLSRSIDGA